MVLVFASCSSEKSTQILLATDYDDGSYVESASVADRHLQVSMFDKNGEIQATLDINRDHHESQFTTKDEKMFFELSSELYLEDFHALTAATWDMLQNPRETTKDASSVSGSMPVSCTSSRHPNFGGGIILGNTAYQYSQCQARANECGKPIVYHYSLAVAPPVLPFRFRTDCFFYRP